MAEAVFQRCLTCWQASRKHGTQPLQHLELSCPGSDNPFLISIVHPKKNQGRYIENMTRTKLISQTIYLRTWGFGFNCWDIHLNSLRGVPSGDEKTIFLLYVYPGTSSIQKNQQELCKNASSHGKSWKAISNKSYVGNHENPWKSRKIVKYRETYPEKSWKSRTIWTKVFLPWAGVETLLFQPAQVDFGTRHVKKWWKGRKLNKASSKNYTQLTSF